MKSIGGISQDNEFIIYGYSSNKLIFSKNFGNCTEVEINNINQQLSCKFIEGETFICAMIINFALDISLFKYHIDILLSSDNSLTKYNNPNYLTYDSISSFGLYDTDNNYIKLLCQKNNQSIYCNFLEIIMNDQYSFVIKSNDNLVFTTANGFTEKNCYFSLFNSEYLFCCGITDYIKCYRINCNSYYIIKQFNISIIGDNSYLTIKNNSDYATFFFMNCYNNTNSIYA